MDVLSSFISSARYTRHEFTEYVLPVVESETLAASADPATKAIEVAHTLAFRSGLGSSLFASSHPSFTAEDIKSFATSAFSSGNIAVLGTGIDQATLTKLVEKSLGKLESAASTPAAEAKSTYYGGETRIDSSHGPQTVFIGFGTAGVPSSDLAALAAHISPQPAVKWSQGTSSIAAASPPNSLVQTVYLPYSDATLFGLLVQGATPADVKEAGKAAVAALKAGIKEADVKKAIAKAKFSVASSLESREGLISVLGSKVCECSSFCGIFLDFSSRFWLDPMLPLRVLCLHSTKSAPRPSLP